MSVPYWSRMSHRGKSGDRSGASPEVLASQKRPAQRVAKMTVGSPISKRAASRRFRNAIACTFNRVQAALRKH